MWWAHEKGKVVEGGKVKGLSIVTGFTNSQKLAWMNNLIITLESETDLESQKFKTTGYEWKQYKEEIDKKMTQPAAAAEVVGI